MTIKVETTDFITPLLPLFPKLDKEDLSEIFHTYILASEDSTSFSDIHRKESKLKRTIYVFPRDQKLYISLKRKDITYINNNRKEICQTDQMDKIFGIFKHIGFVIQNGRQNTCKPIICVDFKESISFSFQAKVTRNVAQSYFLIEEEMVYRRQYNDDPCVPRLLHHEYYWTKREGQGYYKHLEISELLHRDLHCLLYDEEIDLLTDNECYSILFQVTHIIARFHKNHTIHGDVKPENIFIGRNAKGEILAKLGDFGHLSELQNLRTANGTHNYWAPEQMKYSLTKTREDQNEIAYASDTWGIGWLIVHLFVKRAPAWYEKQYCYLKLYKENKSGPELKRAYNSYYAALKKHCNMPEPPKSDFIRHILWHCWRIDPSKRITAENLKQELSNRFPELYLPEKE